MRPKLRLYALPPPPDSVGAIAMVSFSAEPLVTFSSERSSASPPDLRILHYNDVYHVDPSSAEPVGGIARFITVCKEYRESDKYRGQPGLVTLFSGDVFSPSLESSITKGSHHPLETPLKVKHPCVANDCRQGVTWSRF